MIRDRFIRVTSESARRQGIDWTARHIYFSDNRATIALLEKLIKDLKEGRDGQASGSPRTS